MKIPDRDKTEIANRLRREREDRKLTLADVGKKARCSLQPIYEIERAGSFSERLLRDVCAALELNWKWLRFGAGPKHISEAPDDEPSPNNEQMAKALGVPAGLKGEVRLEAMPQLRWIPVVSWATAGAAKDYNDLANFLDEKIPTESRDENAFGLIVQGNSMEPMISEGSRVTVSPNKEAQSGNVVIARTRKDHGVFLKKFFRFGPNGTKVRLVSVNPDYPPLEFNLSDFRFIYPVVGVFRKL